MKKVSIVIINYNGEKETRECLDSLLEINQEDVDLSTIVVDNYPQNPISIDAKKYSKINLELIFLKKNLGFSGGNNKGIEKALEDGAEYVLILNNDTLVEKNFLQELLSVIESDSSIGIVSPKIYFEKGFEFHKERYPDSEKGKVIWFAGGIIDWKNIITVHRGVDEVDKGQYDQMMESDFATGCALLAPRDIFKKTGGFDDSYFLYYEDNDLSQRVKKMGYKIIYAPKSIIWHKNASSSGGSGSKLQDYFISRNRMIFGMRYASMRAKFALIKESLNLLLKGRELQKKGVKDFYLRKFNRGSMNI